MPAAKTDEMTQAVGVDESGGLWALPGGGDWELIEERELAEEVSWATWTGLNLKRIAVFIKSVSTETNTTQKNGFVYVNGNTAYITNNFSITTSGTLRYAAVFSEIVGGFQSCLASDHNNNFGQDMKSVHMMHYPNASESITELKIWASQNNGVFGVGTTFWVYGVRA